MPYIPLLNSCLVPTCRPPVSCLWWVIPFLMINLGLNQSFCLAAPIRFQDAVHRSPLELIEPQQTSCINDRAY